MKGKSLPGWAMQAIGLVSLVIFWWLFSVIAFPPNERGYSPVPTPLQVVMQIAEDGLEYYWRFFAVTLQEAGIGYVWGNAIALIMSALVLIVPRLEPVVMQLAVITYCVPIVAVGAIAIIVIGGSPGPGQPSATAIFLAALSVFFTTVVGSVLGFKAADKASLDVVTVYGGSKFTQLYKVRLVAALPSILTALQIAVPAAFLGAVLGEYMGKIELSIGTQLVLAQMDLQAGRVWAIFILSAIVALTGYLLVGLIAKFIAPWASGKAS